MPSLAPIDIETQILPHAADLPLPRHQTEGAAGLDLYAALLSNHVTGGHEAMLEARTGLAMAIPAGYVGLIRTRSGLFRRYGVRAFEGTIDSDYRGEIVVMLSGPTHGLAAIQRGERIAQLVIIPFLRARLVERDALDASERGAAGFGSTGTNG